MSLFRRRRLPAERRPPIEPEERIVAWAGATDGEVVVLTNHGIWLPGATARLGWHEIHKATWSGRQLALVASREVGAEEGYTIVADQPAIVHTLLDPDNVPLQVRVRVTKSIVYTQVHPLPDGGAVRVVARRVPGIDGLSWTVRYEDGADPTDERVRAMTEELVAYGKASVAGARP